MSEHISEWLGPYLDGELRGRRRESVEAHLAVCGACQAELESLASLSDLLDRLPAPNFTPAERFAAQVSLRLPRRHRETSPKKILEIGWWLVPVGLLTAWIFVSTSFLVNDIVSTANSLGLPVSLSDRLAFGTAHHAYWSAALGQFGILSGTSLDWAASVEVFTRTSLPQLTLQASIALLYLSWIAIWWARHTRQKAAQLVES